MMIIILCLAIAAGVAFLLMKSGKIEDKNGNNVPDKLEPMIEDVQEVVVKAKKVVKSVGEKKPVKKSAKKAK